MFSTFVNKVTMPKARIITFICKALISKARPLKIRNINLQTIKFVFNDNSSFYGTNLIIKFCSRSTEVLNFQFKLRSLVKCFLISDLIIMSFLLLQLILMHLMRKVEHFLLKDCSFSQLFVVQWNIKIHSTNKSDLCCP